MGTAFATVASLVLAAKGTTMRNYMYGLGAAVALVLGAPAAQANVTCTPSDPAHPSGNCTSAGATFVVSPSGVGPGFNGPITASISDAGIASGSFTDTFNFILPYSGTGGGAVTSIAALFQGSTDLDFSAIILNGTTIASVAMGNIMNGLVDVASASSIMLGAGPNSLQIVGVSRGNGSYGGSLSFTPAVPELGVWGMMILGFGAIGGAMRYRRRSTKVSFA